MAVATGRVIAYGRSVSPALPVPMSHQPTKKDRQTEQRRPPVHAGV